MKALPIRTLELKQPHNRATVLNKSSRAIERVAIFGLGIDAKSVMDRCQKVVRVDRV